MEENAVEEAVDALMHRFGQLANGHVNKKFYDEPNFMESTSSGMEMSRIFIRKIINAFLIFYRFVLFFFFVVWSPPLL